MKREVGVFQAHVSFRSAGGKASLDFLNLQIQKLEGLSRQDPDAILSTVQATQTRLLSDVRQAATIYDGITPQESEMMSQIGEKADQYIRDYKQAQQSQVRIQTDLTRKRELLANPPLSPIGQAALKQADQIFMQKVETLLQAAPKGSPLEELRKLYTALSLANNPDTAPKLRARIDVEKIQQRIQSLSEQPEVQAVFSTARQQALQEVFSPGAAQELADHLLSPAFREFLSLQSESDQSTLLQTELSKLYQLDPQKAAEVRHELVGKQLEAKAGEILAGLSLEERKSAFAKVFGVINNPNNAIDKCAKVADALAQAFEGLSPQQMQALQNPAQMYTYLSGKLAGMGENGQAALEYIKSLQTSGKLGALMTVTAAVATTGKLPDALSNGDIKSIADLSSSLLSLAGNGKNVATLFNLTEQTLQSAKALKALSTLKSMEMLGPVGDILGAGVDAYGAVQDYTNGDYTGATFKGVSALAGGTGAVAGLFILAGSTGPAAPVVLVGAAIIGGLAWGADLIWGESEEMTFLRQLDVLKPEP